MTDQELNRHKFVCSECGANLKVDHNGDLSCPVCAGYKGHDPYDEPMPGRLGYTVPKEHHPLDWY